MDSKHQAVYDRPMPPSREVGRFDIGQSADLLANVIGYQIISTRLENAVRELVASHTKTLAPPLFLAKNKKQAVHDYVLLQLCRAFPCVNK